MLLVFELYYLNYMYSALEHSMNKVFNKCTFNNNNNNKSVQTGQTS